MNNKRITTGVLPEIVGLQGSRIRTAVEDKLNANVRTPLENRIFAKLWRLSLPDNTPQLEINGIDDYVAADLGGDRVVDWPYT